MVLDRSSCVSVFADITTRNDGDDEPKHVNKFEVASKALAIAFHWTTETCSPSRRPQMTVHKCCCTVKKASLNAASTLSWRKEMTLRRLQWLWMAASVLRPGRRCLYFNKKLVYPFIWRLDSGVSKPRGKPLFVAANSYWVTYDKQIGKSTWGRVIDN